MLLLFACRQPAPIFKLKGQRYVSLDHLQWALYVLPDEGCAKWGMSIDDVLPDSLDDHDIYVTRFTAQLCDIDAFFRLIETMEEQTLLERRQRVDVFDVINAHAPGEKLPQVSRRLALVEVSLPRPSGPGIPVASTFFPLPERMRSRGQASDATTPSAS